MNGVSLPAGSDAPTLSADFSWRRLRLDRCTGFALAVLVATVVGCGSDDGSPPTTPAGDRPADDAAASSDSPIPGQLLSRMIAAYQSAKAYSDRGTLRLRQKQGDRWVEETAEFSVVFERPNRLLLRAHRATISSDGGEFRARIEDERTSDLDGQVVVRPAPTELTLGQLYEEGDQVDPVLAESLAGQLGVVPIQLNLLLADEPLVELLVPTPPLSTLPDDQVDSHLCARVVVGTKSGELVFWIDKESHVLRRLQYPGGGSPASGAEGGDQPQFELIADLVEARLDPHLPESAFAWEVPATAKRVKYFVPTVAPLPTKFFGKPVGEFWFSDLNGNRVPADEFAGRVSVFVWYQDHPACEQTLRRLQSVYQEKRDDEKFSFRVVSVDTPEFSHQDVQAVLDRWGVSVPAVRDVAPCGPDVFDIKEAPSLVVLDREGVLQYCEVGANPDLAEQLAGVLDRIEGGGGLADEILSIHKQQEQSYVDQLEMAMGERPSTVVPLTEAKLAARSEPKQLRLLPRWRCDGVQSPGNMLAVESAEGPRFYVLDGWRSVAEIDSRGEIVKLHRLPLPDQVGISRLRTAVDGVGRRWFAGFEVHGQQAFLFDDQWDIVATYPPADQKHDGLADVQLADLAGDGTVQWYLGFWGAAGVHAATLEGRSLWRSREVSSVVAMAVSWPDEVDTRRLLVTSDQGQILPLNRFRHPYPRLRVGRWPIHGLTAAGFSSPTAAAYCGTSFEAGGRRVMVGINRDMDDLWNYALPPGVFQTQLEQVSSADLLAEGPGFWVFAAANGTVHLVSEDGKFGDQFGYGDYVTGLTAARIGQKGVLVIAGREGAVDCYQVESR